MNAPVVVAIELPTTLQKLHLPPGVQQRLQSLLNKQDAGVSLSTEEREEAEGLVDVGGTLFAAAFAVTVQAARGYSAVVSVIPTRLIRLVRRRAAERCEYCGLAQAGQEATFHIDHINPVVAGEATVSANLAVVCPRYFSPFGKLVPRLVRR